VEGSWSLLRSWLRPHRGISQDKLPLYLGFFQFVHNARRRGKALLGALIRPWSYDAATTPEPDKSLGRLRKPRHQSAGGMLLGYVWVSKGDEQNKGSGEQRIPLVNSELAICSRHLASWRSCSAGVAFPGS